MGEVQDQEAKFLSSCEAVKPDKLHALKIKCCDRDRINTQIPKERNKEGVMGSKQV